MSKFRIVSTTHGETCVDCLRMVDSAIITARVTGSVGATYSDSSHAATVRRSDMPLVEGERSRDGLLEITYIQKERNGDLTVTVRELIGRGANGSGWIGGTPERRMRYLARKAADFPVAGTSVVQRFHDACDHVTFRVRQTER